MTNSILIRTFLNALNQIKTYHWQTENYARHIASGNLYDQLNTLIDQFIEVYQGKYGRIRLTASKEGYTNLSDRQIVQFLNDLREFLIITLPSYLDPRIDTDLFNIRDEMLANVDQTLYLFTFK